MQDRFKDLAFLAKTNPVMQEREAEEEGQSPRSEEFMSSFFHNVTEVKVNLKKLDNNVKDLEERYAKQLGTVDTKEKKKVATEVNKVIDDTNSIANKVKKKLQEMANVKQEATDEAGLAEARIRKSTHTSLVQRFVEIMEQYQASQAKYQKQYRENVERQIKIVKPEVTQQEVEETVQSGNADRIFASKLVDRRAAAESALTYIKDRHDEIVKITKSLEELHNLFIDMNVLIQEQGEMINSIAFNVRSTKEHTKKKSCSTFKESK